MTTALQLSKQLIAPLPKPVTVEQFIDWYPDNAEYHYELRDGSIYQMPQPRGQHSEVSSFSRDELIFESRRAKYNYFIPQDYLVRINHDTAYKPDVLVLDRTELKHEPLWETASTVQKGTSIKLVIEVTSTNWQDDYEVKLAAYESIGIPEYWIIDYAGLGGIRHIGKPKQPTLTLCTLVDGEYEVSRLRGEAKVSSVAFPDLDLTAGDLLGSSQ